MKQNSALPEFWCSRYRSGVTPWDSRQCPPDVARFIAEQTAGTRTLVPGCGSAVELASMIDHALDVLAIDFSPEAVQAAQRLLGKPADERVREADFFALESSLPYQWVYERAFLCALPPSVWSGYADKMCELVAPGGVLAGYFFLKETPKGPPFGIHADQLHELLGSGFQCEESRLIESVVPIFQGHEFWQVWRRVEETNGSSTS